MALHLASVTPRRSSPFQSEPAYYEPAGLWLYGNVKLLDGDLAFCLEASDDPTPPEPDDIERKAEFLVLAGKILVCGVHNDLHRRAATVPLRWGSPRIVVFSGGFHYHLGEHLDQEPFLMARLWRYAWDPKTDLAISRRAPGKLPTYAHHNPTVDRLIERLVARDFGGSLFGNASFTRAGRGWAEVVRQ